MEQVGNIKHDTDADIVRAERKPSHFGEANRVVGGAEHKAVRLKVYSFYPQMKAESQCWMEGIANTLVNGTNPGYQNGIVYETSDSTGTPSE